jgi:hypothetical protein
MARETAPPPDPPQPSALDLLDPAPATPPPAGEPGAPRQRRARRPSKGAYQKAVEKDLARLPADLAEGSVAAGMLRLAVELDTGIVLGRDAAAHVREIRQSFTTLRELSPAGRQDDKTDEVTARREKRLSQSAARSR